MIEEQSSMLSSFYRERTYWCGNSYKLVSVVPRFKKQEERMKRGRKKHKNISRPAQQNLNKKNSQRYLRLLINGNFQEGDLFLTLTYKNKFLPKTPQEAKKEFNNFIRRLKTRLAKQGKADQLKYVVITEYREETDSKKGVRFHHHVIINNIIDRDELEEIWSRKVNKKKVYLGSANTKKIRVDGDYSLDRLAAYLSERDDRKKEWSSSRNLIRPETTKDPVDTKFRRREIEKAAYSNDCGQEFFEKKYPNYFVTIEAIRENEYSGYHYYLKLEKKKRGD